MYEYLTLGVSILTLGAVILASVFVAKNGQSWISSSVATEMKRLDDRIEKRNERARITDDRLPPDRVPTLESLMKAGEPQMRRMQ